MSWHLYTINPKKADVVISFAESVEGVDGVVYKRLDTEKVTKTGKKVKKIVAVFPNYLFLDLQEDLEDYTKSRLLDHPYVYRWVGSLSEEESKELEKINTDNSYSKKFMDSFSEGDVVKILNGLFKDYKATVLAVKSDGVLIQTSLNGAPVKYTCSKDEIERVRGSS